MNLKLSSIGLLCAIGLLTGAPNPAQACGPFMPGPVFSHWAHPELPLQPYAAGKLGVLGQRYARSYLVVAYRHLAGTPLNADEQAAAVQLWETRLGTQWGYGEEPWLAAWVEARKQVPGSGEAPSINVSRSISGDTFYFDYLNCPEEAFKNAAATLNDRAQKQGAASPAVLAWLQAQDQVFASCGEPQQPPAALPEGADALQQADRAYQIAAAQFYAGDYAAAEQGFTAIAQDSTSPWKPYAGYLVARTLIRRASVGTEAQTEDQAAVTALLQRAEAQLDQVLADPEAAALHPATRKMQGLVRLRAHGLERRTELAQELMAPATDGTCYQDLWDYTTLLDRVVPIDGYAEAAPKFEAQAQVERKEDLTDWILIFQVDGDEAYQHSLERWKATKSLPWLVAALLKAKAGSADLDALLEAAAGVPQDSPGYPTVAFHRARLLLETEKRDEARSVLDAALSVSDLPLSGRNDLLELRLQLARNLDEFLTDAQRKPVLISYLEGPKEEVIEEDNLKWMEESEDNDVTVVRRMREKAPSFDTDGIAFLSALPLDLMAKAVSSSSLPEPLRRDLAITAWSRAVLLDQTEQGQELATAMAGFWPELKSGLEAYQAASTPEDKRFAGVLLMLKFPGLSAEVHGDFGRLTRIDKIDSFRNNWWCNAGGMNAKMPAFLDATQQESAAAETQRLTAAGNGPNWLVQQVLDRAQAVPADPNLAEALHLAVRSTRYGCTDENTGRQSKAAFTLLHKKFKDSEWAKKTKHWFN